MMAQRSCSGNLRRISRHRAPAVGDRVEEVAHRRLSQSIVIKRSGAAETASHDHAVAVAGQSVTGGTEDFVTLFAAIDDLFGHRQSENFDVVRISSCALSAVRRRPAAAVRGCCAGVAAAAAALPAFLPVKNSVSVFRNPRATVPSIGWPRRQSIAEERGSSDTASSSADPACRDGKPAVNRSSRQQNSRRAGAKRADAVDAHDPRCNCFLPVCLSAVCLLCLLRLQHH